MNKLRDRRGFTLTELLCAVLIVLLVSALLTVGVRFAGRTYNSSMQLSEAQELCSTLTSVISDKLRFCGTVTPGADGSLDHIFIQAWRARAPPFRWIPTASSPWAAPSCSAAPPIPGVFGSAMSVCATTALRASLL